VRNLAILSFLIFLSVNVYGDNLPAFKIPANENYELFVYSYTGPSIVEEEVNQKKEVSKVKNLGLKIYGIFISDGKRVVLIGDKILKEGDIIKGYIVKKIESDRVEFVKGNNVIVKKLKSFGSNGVFLDNNTIKSE